MKSQTGDCANTEEVFMKTILRYMKPYRWKIAWGVSVKFLGSMGELLIPFLLEYMVDEIVPTESMKKVLFFGCFMSRPLLSCGQFQTD